MHSHHSHSGDYVSHASDTLELVTNKAKAMGFHTYCLTEHMPRLHNRFLYPEEREKAYTVQNLEDNYTRFHKHALEVRARSLAAGESGTRFLIGFEVEGLDLEHVEYAERLREQYPVDMVVGSVHYTSGIPIDFDLAQWKEARAVHGSTRKLYQAYFDLQYEVVSRLKPEVVGHFDLIRLFTPWDEVDAETGRTLGEISVEHDWPEVWASVVRNAKFIAAYGGLVELNSAAFRKGWATPYPQEDMVAVLVAAGAKFCLSDDAHAVSQVGLNYPKVLAYMERVGISGVGYLDLEHGRCVQKWVDLSTMKQSVFWDQY